MTPEPPSQRLAPIADRLLMHDRPVETRTDDSVLRAATVAGSLRTLVMRRSRVLPCTSVSVRVK